MAFIILKICCSIFMICFCIILQVIEVNAQNLAMCILTLGMYGCRPPPTKTFRTDEIIPNLDKPNVPRWKCPTAYLPVCSNYNTSYRNYCYYLSSQRDGEKIVRMGLCILY